MGQDDCFDRYNSIGLDIVRRLGESCPSSRSRMPTSTVENYLKAILRLDEDAEATISVGAIAELLEVTPGTVSAMMRHLAEQGLIDYVPRRSVSLLPRGRRQALRVVRRHRIIETFLVEVMALDWSEVHEEAEVLEHVISDRLLRRMDEMLGHPRHDPHGDPIPDEEGGFAPEEASAPLSVLERGRFRVMRVDDGDNELLGWLQANGVLPGAEYQLRARDAVAGVIEIERATGEAMLRMSERAASRIFVVPVG